MENLVKFEERALHIPVISYLTFIENYFEAGKPVYIRIYNMRSQKTIFEIHKGQTAFLVRDSHEIYVMNKPQVIKLINEINELFYTKTFWNFNLEEE